MASDFSEFLLSLCNHKSTKMVSYFFSVVKQERYQHLLEHSHLKSPLSFHKNQRNTQILHDLFEQFVW